jgi:putative transposase
MRHHGIRAIMARPPRVRTTDSRHDLPIAPNLLDRNFTATAPNRIWLADITYVETDQGWLYRAAVLDLYSRRIVGWAMADHLRAELPLAVLRMAISTQQPGDGLIHHSDRGVQYDTAGSRTGYLCLHRGLLHRTRRHSAIGYISPIEMELKAT